MILIKNKPWLGKALNVKILAGYCTLKSSSSWLWGVDIILPEKLTATAAWLALLGERRSAEREVAGSNPGRTNT